MCGDVDMGILRPFRWFDMFVLQPALFRRPKTGHFQKYMMPPKREAQPNFVLHIGIGWLILM